MKAGTQLYPWASWAELLEPGIGPTVLATDADQYYAGGAAAITRRLGSGSVTYIGVDSEDGTLELDLVRGVFERTGVGVEEFDEECMVDWRDRFWVATNFTGKNQRVAIPQEIKPLIGERNVPPAGVVWQE